MILYQKYKCIEFSLKLKDQKLTFSNNELQSPSQPLLSYISTTSVLSFVLICDLINTDRPIPAEPIR